MAQIFFKKSEYISYLRSQGRTTEHVADTPWWWKDSRADIYKAASEIPGCTIGFAWSDIYNSDNPDGFIIWKGTRMQFGGYRNDKTRSLSLFDQIDMKGYNIPLSSHSNDADKPNNIGTPTAKKLDEWRTFLLAKRKEDEERVRSTVTKAENQKALCRSMFPGGTEHDGNTWSFSHEQNGIRYTCEVYNSGIIHEDIKVAYDPWSKDSTLVKAFLMMQNPYTPLKKQTA